MLHSPGESEHDMSQEGPGNGGESAPVPSAATEGLPEGLLAPGQVLGDRYQIKSQLGRGGMGEVWRAFDLKLRVEVALKAMLPDLFKNEKRRDLLRREVRAAREVVSPNVCRIFDLIEVGGSELVSMEYVDGGTLLNVLHERGPLDLKEAQDIASQFLAGLEAIHQAGLVHRDVKPENIMITRAGRVVLMDFGLARQEDSGAGTVSGTPAYMAPEQAMGGKVDARADVYSAGVVLAEMVSPEGIKNLESRQSVWEGIRQEPARVPNSPWAPVLKKAVAKEPDHRHNSAHTLIRELEDVTLRVEGADEVTPYPGLAFFTEADAEYFYGREAEVEAMWRTLEQPHLLAIIGPSGSGKSSFLRAGLIPARPQGWSCVVATPGSSPLVELAQALVPEFAGDAEAIRDLVRTDDPDAMASAVARWRERHDQVVLVVDQFEELFTLNPPDVQSRCADLLGRLALENDVHVLLSMRDDFLFHCQAHEALRPVFSEITPLGPLVGGALRRALVQPASRCGYRFDDDDLVVEMLAEVEGERGSLPLLAFAVSRLWEERDRGEGLLTREAYQRIGGVGGALGKHAEDTLERIGKDREPIVREIFRNLITAQATRAVRDLDNLLSVFDQRERDAANDVFRELVDARLLTTFETGGEDEETRRRVEIIHESLLANWPRLVRWQTQDQEGAQFRDELRQAARTWDERNRSDDLLWTGSAYREFVVWRERYPGGLSEVEEAFSQAMTSLATRRRRRRRVAAAIIVVFLTVVATVLGTLWRRSVRETRRAEAAKLLALGQAQLDTDPTEALAYATASLELTDTREARIFAVRALWAGPPLLALDLGNTAEGQFVVPTFSPDGRWLAVAGLVNENVLVYGEDGRDPIVLGGHAVSADGGIQCAWTRDNLLVTGHESENRARMWSLPEGRLVRTIEFEGRALWQVGDEHVFARLGQQTQTPPGEPWPVRLVRWKLPDYSAEVLGSVDLHSGGATTSIFDPRGEAWIYSKGNGVYARRLPIAKGEPDRVIARHSSDKAGVRFWLRPQGIYSSDSNGEIILWTTADGTSVPGRRLRKPETATTRLQPDPAGRWAVDADGSIGEGKASLWDLQGLAGARPIELRRSGSWYYSHSDFDPSGTWVVATTNELQEVSFWPLQGPFPVVVDGYETKYRRAVKFTPDGRSLVTHWGQDRVRLWPLPGAGDRDVVDVKLPSPAWRAGLAVDPTGKNVLSTCYGTTIFLISLTGAEPRRLEGLASADIAGTGAFSPSSRLVAAATTFAESRATLRVWDLSSGESRVFDQPQDPDAESRIGSIAFVDETTLYTGGAYGLLRWNLEAGTSERILEAPPGGGVSMWMASDRRTILVSEFGPSNDRVGAVLYDLTTGEVRKLDIPGGQGGVLAVSPDLMIWASGEKDGSIWIGRIDGGEAHLLAGHEGPVDSVAISPDNKWIASSGDDKTLRLWPMPDLSKPPLHTLPHEELIAKLHSLTNLRAVRGEASSTGWKVEVGPFPGWETVPEW